MSQASWDSDAVAAARKKGAEERNRYMAEVTARMFEEAALAPGMRVLELGAGTGEMATILAEKVGRAGHVLATDAAKAMVDIAREVLKPLADHVAVEVCDASTIPLPEASFDLDVALPSVHRVLRPGARFAAAVWGPAAHNPFYDAVLEAARAEGGWGAARMEVATAFARGDRAMYEGAFGRAAFRDVRVQVVKIERRFSSVGDAIAKARESAIHTAPIDALPLERRAAAWKRVEAGYAAFERDGAVRLPMEWLVVSGAK